MKKTSNRSAPTRSHHSSARKMNKADDLDAVRSEVEQLEQQRIDFETHARLAKDNLYGANPAREPGRGWMDTNK